MKCLIVFFGTSFGTSFGYDCNSTEIESLKNSNANSLRICLDSQNASVDERTNCLTLAGVPLSTSCADCLWQLPFAADTCQSLCQTDRLSISECIACHTQALEDSAMGCTGFIDIVPTTTTSTEAPSTKSSVILSLTITFACMLFF